MYTIVVELILCCAALRTCFGYGSNLGIGARMHADRRSSGTVDAEMDALLAQFDAK